MWGQPPRLPVERSSTLILSPEVGNISHARRNARNAFVVERAPLPAVRNGIGVGPYFVRPQPLKMLALAEEHTHVRPEKLISRADQEIAIEVGYIDQAVGRVMNGVNVSERSSSVCESDNFLHRIDCANGIRGISDGNELCL